MDEPTKWTVKLKQRHSLRDVRRLCRVLGAELVETPETIFIGPEREEYTNTPEDLSEAGVDLRLWARMRPMWE